MIFSKSTFATELDRAKGRPSGFDYMRLLLSIGVLAFHTILMTAGLAAQNATEDSIYRAIPALILPMFFALSGFLVAGSLDRTRNIADFVGLRLLRILPGLCFIVVLSAAVMGPLVTAYSLSDYVADPKFARYFLTILGDVQYELPGVFQHTVYPAIVNGQLWTIPLELLCYCLLIGPALVGVYRRPRLFLGFVLLMQLAFAARAILEPVIYGGIPPKMLTLCFLAGTIMSMFRTKIPFRADLALFCAVLAFGLVYIPGGSYFVAFPAAYLTIYLGLFNPRKFWIVRSGDYSYGVYLFAFPIQQLIASIPSLPQHWYINLGLSLPLSLLMALISWNLIEKRALSYRHYIPQVYRVPVLIYSRTKQKFGAKRTKATR